MHAYDTKTRTIKKIAQGKYSGVYDSDFLLQGDLGYISVYATQGAYRVAVLQCDMEKGEFKTVVEVDETPPLYPGLQEGILVSYKGNEQPGYTVRDYKGNLIKSGDLPLAKGQEGEKTTIKFMGKMDQGILFILSTVESSPRISSLIRVPLEESLEAEILWSGETVMS